MFIGKSPGPVNSACFIAECCNTPKFVEMSKHNTKAGHCHPAISKFHPTATQCFKMHAYVIFSTWNNLHFCFKQYLQKLLLQEISTEIHVTSCMLCHFEAGAPDSQSKFYFEMPLIVTRLRLQGSCDQQGQETDGWQMNSLQMSGTTWSLDWEVKQWIGFSSSILQTYSG